MKTYNGSYTITWILAGEEVTLDEIIKYVKQRRAMEQRKVSSLRKGG